MAKSQKTLDKIEQTREMLRVAGVVLKDYRPQTVRQVYYQLVSRQVIDNNRSQYQRVSTLLVKARQDGSIPWHWIEDRMRKPRQPAMWHNPADFAKACMQYRRNVWQSQENYFELWLEKDALSGIFEDTLQHYGVTLNVGRGYDGWSSIRNAAMRYKRYEDEGRQVSIRYYGDFDPSGEDMVRSLEERLRTFGITPEITKSALNNDDIQTYNLPPDMTKATDSRQAGFVEKWGDVAVELDALPIQVLQQRIIGDVEGLMDMGSFEALIKRETNERDAIVEAVSAI